MVSQGEYHYLRLACGVQHAAFGRELQAPQKCAMVAAITARPALERDTTWMTGFLLLALMGYALT
jgi:hypothetical protein